MAGYSLIKSIKTGDLALIIVVFAGYILYFGSGAYQFSAIPPILMIALGVIYLVVVLLGAHRLALWTERQKAVFFVVTVGIGSVICIYSNGAAWMIMLPLVSEAIQHLKIPWAILICFIVWVADITPAFLSGNTGIALSAALGYLSAVIFVAVFTLITVNEQKMRRELALANDRLREYTRQLEETAVLQERNRMAREIHDGLGHYLTSINIQLKAAQAVLTQDVDAAREAMTKAEYLTQEALHDVRQSVSALRADQPAIGRISDAIQSLIPVDKPGTQFEFSITGAEVELPASIKWMLYRATQELLTNIQKHAGATRVTIMLSFEPSRMGLVVTDNGQGANSLEGGYGLTGVRERVQILGGEMQVDTAPGKGFSVQIQVPVRPAAGEVV
jgi:signal transduction histidine kinase